MRRHDVLVVGVASRRDVAGVDLDDHGEHVGVCAVSLRRIRQRRRIRCDRERRLRLHVLCEGRPALEAMTSGEQSLLALKKSRSVIAYSMVFGL